MTVMMMIERTAENYLVCGVTLAFLYLALFSIFRYHNYRPTELLYQNIPRRSSSTRVVVPQLRNAIID